MCSIATVVNTNKLSDLNSSAERKRGRIRRIHLLIRQLRGRFKSLKSPFNGAVGNKMSR